MATGTALLERVAAPVGLAKAPTGIRGLDEILDGGLPRGRPTLVTGPAGCGKTMLGLEFLVHGARELGEPGVLLTFEETAADLAANVARWRGCPPAWSGWTRYSAAGSTAGRPPW